MAAGEPDASVVEMLAMERAARVTDASCYASFALKTNQLRTNLRALLSSLKSQGKSIAAYGASAKGSTLLNYFGLVRETLDFVVDRHREARAITPGSHLPILPPETLVGKTA
jgi:hypothetical protein